MLSHRPIRCKWATTTTAKASLFHNEEGKRTQPPKRYKLMLLILLSYLDMVLVEALDNRVSEELVIGSNVLPMPPRPVHILLPSSKGVVVVHEAQYHLNPMLPGLR
jgi:hypothetical protein